MALRVRYPISFGTHSDLYIIGNCFHRCRVNSSGILMENVETCINDDSAHLEIRIPNGKIRGVHMTTYQGRTFFGFKGIPYAQPPVRNLRFKAPVPAVAWNDTLDGSIDSKQCPHILDNTIIGDEDCLYLNIFIPQVPTGENSTLLPVMVYIYGGIFKKGTNSPQRWGPQFILDKDVILVLPSYRAGVLGYLSTGDESSPGNYGLKDLVLALQWIQDNISYFGGDPDRITLAGGSSGAICVQLLTLTDATKGLFHRYITQSGSALSLVAQQPRKTIANYTIQLGKYLGCPTKTSSVLVECLRGFNVSQLISIESILSTWDGFPEVIWGPTVEPEIEGALLTDRSANLFAAGKMHNLPHLSSVTRNEGIVYRARFYRRSDTFQHFLNNLDFLLPYVSQYNDKVDNISAYTAALKSYYLNDLTADPNVLLNNFTQLTGDVAFTYPAYSAIRQELHHGKGPLYLCSFEYRGIVSYSYMFSGGSTENWGVAHADELLYLLPGPKALFGPQDYEFSKSDWTMVDTMVQLWTSFVINGTPIISDSDSILTWEPYSAKDNYLQIGNDSDPTLKMKYGFFLERMQFLENLNDATVWL